jgi:EAL domain-containing protein (putative c-di-GMP-specific phosphodiesterase class I)
MRGDLITSPDPSSEPVSWFLEGFVDNDGRLRRVPIYALPFRIGRRADLDLVSGSSQVSQIHAVLFEENSQLMIRDLASTNGTFVNDVKLTTPQALNEGDIIRFATLEFRFCKLDSAQHQLTQSATLSAHSDHPLRKLERLVALRHLLETEAVQPHIQPIVHLEDSSTLGYEILGRSAADILDETTPELFQLAAIEGKEGELSRLFRSASWKECRQIPGQPNLFFNTHPTEFQDPDFELSMEALRKGLPDSSLTLEIHESAVTERTRISRLQKTLQDLDIKLAYDDFGAGQARLVELADAPPDFLKFDYLLIHEIDRATSSKIRLIESLVTMTIDLGVVPIAEGIETEGEARACQSLGFELGQGFWLGSPKPISEVLTSSQE